MKFDIIGWIMSPYVLVFLTLFTGMWFGKINFYKFKFGLSGPLFTGLIIGTFVLKFANGVQEGDAGYKATSSLISSGVVPKPMYTLFLILFVASVGLLASKDLGIVIKKYGAKFAILGILITLLGAGLTYSVTLLYPDGNPYEVAGVYTGALSSSPGFAAAIETSGVHAEKWVASYETENTHNKEKILRILDPTGQMTPENTPKLTAEQQKNFVTMATGSTGAGHAISYPFGIIIVILAMGLFPKIFKINMDEEKRLFTEEMKSLHSSSSKKEIEEGPFDLVAFAFACFAGYTIGMLKINMGPLGYFSLGATGGVLIGSLALGYIGKIGSLNFRMDPKVTAAIRNLSLASFAGSVGLKYGLKVVNSITGSGLNLVIISLIVSIVCMLVAFLIGRYVMKINWIMLSGAICGGMTSTPGLGAAIDASGSDDPAAGYGATYPFALIGMVLFTIILHNLPY